ncbi:hypothetical protein BCR42DRAFT_429161 [Absidia repens]|uniref:Uncharacterized protein n=1 Tax=Absidia repens TaxID=90262 RepID=A0A1X2HXA1_9FUNG|nr:hypothetical protein BCR42DRAFT_429161 [Absidia repens]
MVQASSFLLLVAFSAVMIQGAPLNARSNEHRTKDNTPLMNPNYTNLNCGQQSPGVRSDNQQAPDGTQVTYGYAGEILFFTDIGGGLEGLSGLGAHV